MKEYTTIAKVFSGGKVTVPKPVREALRLRDGDLVEITIKLIEPEADEKQGNCEAFPASA